MVVAAAAIPCQGQRRQVRFPMSTWRTRHMVELVALSGRTRLSFCRRSSPPSTPVTAKLSARSAVLVPCTSTLCSNERNAPGMSTTTPPPSYLPSCTWCVRPAHAQQQSAVRQPSQCASLTHSTLSHSLNQRTARTCAHEPLPLRDSNKVTGPLFSVYCTGTDSCCSPRPAQARQRRSDTCSIVVCVYVDLDDWPIWRDTGGGLSRRHQLQCDLRAR